MVDIAIAYRADYSREIGKTMTSSMLYEDYFGVEQRIEALREDRLRLRGFSLIIVKL